MAKGKYVKQVVRGTKPVALMLALILALVGVIGGTVAWLIANTDPVVNTFTYGDINIKLEETDTNDGDNDPDTNEYEMLPGQEIEKDPKVTVEAQSEANWLFVKLEKSGGATVDGTVYTFDDYLTYTIADGWTQLYKDGVEVEGVYYRFVAKDEDNSAESFAVLAGDKVTVKETVTKAMLNALDSDSAATTYPTLKVTAYAVQYAGFQPEITAGATAATKEQVNAAALKAWNAVVAQNTPANP